jgi:drug/metabolite transporter (DMT)-like permease
MNLTALIALLAGALAIASSGIFVRLSETDPVATAFWRVALAIPIFAAWCAWERRRAAPRAPAAPPPARGLLLAGAFFAGDLVFWHWALMATSVAAATLESNLTPIFVVLAAWALRGERPTPRFTVALLVALLGVLLIAWPKLAPTAAAAAATTGAPAGSAGSLRGDLFGVVTAVFYAGYLWTVAELREHRSTATVMLATVIVAAAILLPPALGGRFLPQTARGWALVLGLALIAQCLGQGLITYALAHLPRNLSAVGLYLQPVAAAAYAWALLGESLAPVQLAGGAVVIAGIALARRAGARATAPARR